MRASFSRFRRPTPALAVSIAALVIASIGTAAALPGGSTVRSSKVSDQSTLWALINGSTDTVIASSGNVSVTVGPGDNADWVNFHQKLTGRALVATPQWNLGGGTIISAAICGGQFLSSGQTTGCDFSNNKNTAYVQTESGNGNFYIAVLPK